MKIAFISESLDISFGGPAQSIPKLVAGLLKHINHFKIFIVKRQHAPLRNDHLEKLTLNYDVYETSFGLKTDYCPKFAKSLISFIKDDEEAIIHVNNLWRWAPYKALKLAQSMGRKTVFSPRGMLLEGALSKGKFIKILAWKLCFKSLVNKVDCIHVTSKNEAYALRKMGLTVPIAVIAHGIDPYKTVSLQQKKSAKKNLNLSVDRQYILFLSRVIEHKGVHLLLEAFSNIPDDTIKNFDILIAGDFEDLEYKCLIERMVIDCNLTNRVRFFGGVSGATKNDIFCAASFFVLPSRSENFGIVVGEALSYGLPVITTHGTPWSVLSDKSIGAWIPRKVEDIEINIKKFCSMPYQEYEKLQSAICKTVSHYTWEKTSKEMFDLYSWLGDQKITPDFVFYNQP